MSSDTVFYWRRWPSGLTLMSVAGAGRVVSGRIQQTADFAHTLQDARRHSARERGVHGIHVMTLHRAKAGVLIPVQGLPRALGTGGADEYYIGITREHRFLVDRGCQRRQAGEHIVATAQ